MNDNQNQDGVVFDNKTQPAESQPQPIYETVAVENTPVQEKEDVSEPEVIPDDVAVETSQSSDSGGPTDIPPDAAPPIYEEDKNKFIFIGIGAFIFFIVFIFIISLALGAKRTKPQSITLTYWGLWEDKGVLDPVIQDYERLHPGIKIDYIKMDPQDYRAKIIARSRQGTGPDIFRFHNTWTSTMTDVLAPLPKSIVSDDEFKKTFYPIHETDLKIGNYYYGLPLEIDSLVLVYNDTKLKQVGLEVPPKTWEDMMADIAKLTVKDANGNIVTSGLAMGTATNVDHFSDIFGWMLLQNGGDLKNISGNEGQGTLQLYRRFAEKPNNIWDENMPNSTTAFIQQKVAMIIVPSWEIMLIKQADPELSFKVTTLPILPGGSLLTLSNYWVEGVSKYSKNQVEAWKFLSYLTQKDVMTKMYEQETKIRPFGEPYSRQDLGKILLSDPYIGPVMQQATAMKSLPMISRTQDGGINDEIVKYIENAMNSTAKGVSYSEALATAQQGITQVYAKYKIQ